MGVSEGLPPLVDGAWLSAALGAPDLRVLDYSFYLPTEQQDARAHFEAAHIPGARFCDIEALADQETDLPHMVPAAGRFARAVSALGISNADRVVIYDQKGMFSAPRGWWLFRLFGHERIAVLDGGLPQWLADGRAVENGVPPAPAPGHFVPALRAGMLRGLGDMLSNVAGGEALVLDARPAGRFAGTAPEPRPGLPSGHMPGSVSLPAGELLVDGRRFLPAETLRARFASAGVDGRRPVITSCGTGVTAAVLTMGMVLAGLPEGALYDGSWTEWAGHADTPKVRS
jgi:thiosulfate/3-mercaptopyruvate sulfurtransferase